jgi:hypothetical protein
MPRPRLTEDDYRQRLAAYCTRYDTRVTPSGIPPYPAGKRETPQHREWIALHRLHDRLRRRSVGKCQQCEQPAVPGRLFCEAHGIPPGGQPPKDVLASLLEAQAGACYVCEESLEANSSRYHGPAGDSTTAGVVLHADCLRLVQLAEKVGSAGLTRVRGLLRSGGSGRGAGPRARG